MKELATEDRIEALEEELKRKDAIIERLREENTLLMRTSVKAADERLALKEKLHELEERG